MGTEDFYNNPPPLKDYNYQLQNQTGSNDQMTPDGQHRSFQDLIENDTPKGEGSNENYITIQEALEGFQISRGPQSDKQELNKNNPSM